VFTYQGAAVSWASKKLRSVTNSTAAAEYMAAAEAAREAVWLRRVAADLGVALGGALPLHSDNQACIIMGEASADSSKTKHVDIACHYLREQVARGVLRLVFVPTAENVADVLTKPLPGPKFVQFRGLLGVG